MKNMVMVIVSAILGALMLVIVIAMGGRMNRSMEIKSSLASIMEETVADKKLTQLYQTAGSKELLADLAENLSAVLDTDSGLSLDIYKAEDEKGILSVRAEERFQHPNGKTGTTACERMALFDKASDPAPNVYWVTFYGAYGECYKTYAVREGDVAAAPAEPEEAGKVFAGWMDENGYLADFTQPVTQSLKYYADWK